MGKVQVQGSFDFVEHNLLASRRSAFGKRLVAQIAGQAKATGDRYIVIGTPAGQPVKD
jgi:hypothetical protein